MPVKLTDAEATTKQEEIAAAAAAVFGEKGYEGATVKDLEAATGLTRGGIFFHFESKRALFLAAIRQSCMGGSQLAGEAALAQSTVEEAMLAAFRVVLDWLQDHPEASRFMDQMRVRRNVEPDIAELDETINATMEAFVGDLLGQLKDTGVIGSHVDAATAGIVVHAVLEWLFDYAAVHGREAAEAKVRDISAILADGLRPRRDP